MSQKDKKEGLVRLVSPVLFDKELQGERGEKITTIRKRLAESGEFPAVRKLLLRLLDAGLEKELNQ